MPWTINASISASAPIRVRLRGRTSRSMSLRACSTAAAPTASRRPARGSGGRARSAGCASRRFALRDRHPLGPSVRRGPATSRTCKDPRRPGEGPVGLRWPAPQWRSSLRVPPFSRREPVMRRPRRPSSPARSERSESRRDTWPVGSSLIGMVTRRPSVVTTTATRWRSPKKPKRLTPIGPPVAGARSLDAATTIAQPPVPGPSSRSAPQARPVRVRAETKRPPRWRSRRVVVEGHARGPFPHFQRCPASMTMSGRGRMGGVATSAKGSIPFDAIATPVPPDARANAEGHGREQRHGPDEARQVRLHVRLLRACRCITTPATGRSSRRRSLALRPRLATGLPWTVASMEDPRWSSAGT